MNENRNPMLQLQQKQTGSFYTEGKIAEAVVNWAIRNANDSILEPSFGNGIFIEKAITRFNTLGATKPNITAVEIQPNVAKYVCGLFPKKRFNAFTADFLSLPLQNQHDVVIGNPPYIGIKKLPKKQAETARKVIEKHEIYCPNNGSLWFPFVLHAISALKSNGKLAFVLPFEVTYARYAYGLWEILSKNFSNLTIYRIHEDFFPEVDVEAILFLAEGKGGNASKVNYTLFNTISDLQNNKPFQTVKIPVRTIIATEKPFVSCLLSKEQQDLLQVMRSNHILSQVIKSCKFKIGYVSADKNYFHPNPEIIAHYSISKDNLYPCVLNAKELNGGTGIGIDVSKGQCPSKLFFPKNIAEGDKRYIQNGEVLGVHKRYKCRQRDPWYITPNIEIPDVILSVFGEKPKMVVNKGNYVVSNSLLCGCLKNVDSKQFVCRWYNSLTLLSIELNVHSLGGGSFVIIPSEADRLEIVAPIPQKEISKIYSQFDETLKKSGTEAAYLLGDKLVLQNIFNLSDKDILTIRQSIAILRNWRTPATRRA